MGKRLWIAKAVQKKGALRASMGIKKGAKIPAGRLATVAHGKGVAGRRARLAQTLRGFHKS